MRKLSCVVFFAVLGLLAIAAPTPAIRQAPRPPQAPLIPEQHEYVADEQATAAPEQAPLIKAHPCVCGCVLTDICVCRNCNVGCGIETSEQNQPQQPAAPACVNGRCFVPSQGNQPVMSKRFTAYQSSRGDGQGVGKGRLKDFVQKIFHPFKNRRSGGGCGRGGCG